VHSVSKSRKDDGGDDDVLFGCNNVTHFRSN